MTATRLGRQSMALGLVVLVLGTQVSRSHAADQLRIGYASPSVNVSFGLPKKQSYSQRTV